MKIKFLFIILLGSIFNCSGQLKQTLSSVINEVSIQWKKDSTACNGYRNTVSKKFTNCQIAPLTKNELISKLGKPNRTDKFYSGISRKTHIVLVYYTYKDNCPEIRLEGSALQFIFDESGSVLIEIEPTDYCG